MYAHWLTCKAPVVRLEQEYVVIEDYGLDADYYPKKGDFIELHANRDATAASVPEAYGIIKDIERFSGSQSKLNFKPVEEAKTVYEANIQSEKVKSPRINSLVIDKSTIRLRKPQTTVVEPQGSEEAE